MEEFHYKNGLMEGERILNWRNGNLKEKNFFKRGAMTGARSFIFQMVIQEKLYPSMLTVEETESG